MYQCLWPRPPTPTEWAVNSLSITALSPFGPSARQSLTAPYLHLQLHSQFCGAEKGSDEQKTAAAIRGDRGRVVAVSSGMDAVVHGKAPFVPARLVGRGPCVARFNQSCSPINCQDNAARYPLLLIVAQYCPLLPIIAYYCPLLPIAHCPHIIAVHARECDAMHVSFLLHWQLGRRTGNWDGRTGNGGGQWAMGNNGQ